MDGIFTLPYSEFEIVNIFQDKFKKSSGYSLYIPVSRQEKGVDFILFNSKIKSVKSFQVKSSRAYIHETKIKKNGELKPPKYRYHLWLNNFKRRYSQGLADFYLIFGLYPAYDKSKSMTSDFYKTMILCFTDKEMGDLLDQVKTKKEGKEDRFFSFSFNLPEKIFGTRGFVSETDFSRHILENQIETIKNAMNNEN
ncbi:MAG: hypothetical protein CVU43_21280 [Chloroflexi bacterium HGW-Chloroflexi-5]|jgi:hypothetical protein|nr:MAG: hypothetical protein CVU43_21280 [Chloroflexi bacterium HGW-Chloroflexi-5]